jgi:integrase
MSQPTVREGLTLYQNRISILKKGYEQEKYRIAQINRSFLGEKIARAVTSVDIATYRDLRLQEISPNTKRKLSTSTVRLEMSLLSNFFDIGRIEWGICDINPVATVRKPKMPAGRDRRLTPREDRQILRYCHNHSNTELYSIVVLALETAMRQAEILNLHWEHLNLRTRIAHLPETKNGTKRDVPLSLAAREVLLRLGVKSKGRVFNYTSSGLKSTWRYMTNKLGIKDLHFHDCRHEAISRLFELGSLDIMEVSAISGHKSLSMLKRYTHLKAQRLVRKLEGHKSRGKQMVLNHLIPYPAIMETQGDQVQIRLLDFDDLVGNGKCHESAIQVAQDILLRRLLLMIRREAALPVPDQYLDLIDERCLIMVDPLGDSIL